MIVGALPLAEPFAALDANDARMIDTLNVMDEIATSPKITAYLLPSNWGSTMNVMEEITASVRAACDPDEVRKKKGLPADDAWFWNCYGGGLAKASHNANLRCKTMCRTSCGSG